MKAPNISKGPWKAHFNVPTAAIPGHIVKTDDDVASPVCLIWEGGGTKGKPVMKANATAIAALPDLLKALSAVVFADSECVRDTNMPIWGDALRHSRAALEKAGYTL